jgi:pimeloyl-ACP methyl ester carboxylesterase
MVLKAPDLTNSDRALARRLNRVVGDLQFEELAPGSQDGEATSDGILGHSLKRRRDFQVQDFSGLATLALIEDEGLLRWDYQAPSWGVPGRRAQRAARRPIGSQVLHEFSFRETPPNQVLATLEGLDRKLTQHDGLRLFKDGKLQPVVAPKVDGRVLLLVHGTFSKSEMFIDEFGATEAGKEFLRRASTQYSAVLLFDHPTLSISPWVNALDLETAMANVSGPIDVICHSRGGLVIAWWLRNARRLAQNVIFVGSPLEGTSLASPASLRSALDYLANVMKGLEIAGCLASTMVPLIGIVAGLSKILGGTLRFGSKTPMLDAAIAVVPGLAAQSRVQNNAELDRLVRMPWMSTPQSFAVTSNFAPAEADHHWWQVWKAFSNSKDRLLRWGADAIFDEENDLVVNTISMTRLRGSSIDTGRVLSFPNSPDVHHCNYFRQERLLEFFSKALDLSPA